MASGSASIAYHSTLSAGTVDTVSLDTWSKYLLIINKSTTATDVIYITTDGTEPEVEGDDTYCVLANSSKMLANEGVIPEPALGVAGSTVIKLICSGTPDYGVETH